MISVNTISDLKRMIIDEKKKGNVVGLVPTMGFLHEGHLKLVEKAREFSDVVVMSIFVNPLQFGEGEDYDAYPSNPEKDREQAEVHGVDILFNPDVPEMYPRPMSTSLVVNEGADVLCGASRPGHFDGVATVVMKLFQIVQPDVAFFGLKDAQQVAVIKRMAEDFHLDVSIKTADTVREADGLAKSSRNVNLTTEERREAPGVYRTLAEARDKYLNGDFAHPAELEVWAEKALKKRLSGKLDYVQFLTFPELGNVEDFNVGGDVILACAARYKGARLIDNVIWKVERG